MGNDACRTPMISSNSPSRSVLMGDEVPILAAQPVGDQDFSRFAGWYKNEAPAAQIEFQLGEDGNLYIPTRTAAPIQLMYMGGSSFLYGDENVSLTFNIDVVDPTGKAVSVTITNAGQTLTAQRVR